MAKAGIEIKMIIDDKDLKGAFRKMEKKGKNLRPYLKKVGILMLRSFDLNFIREGRPRKWKRLTPNTVASRRRGSSRILQDSGRLRQSTLVKGSKDNVYRLNPNSLKMGTRSKIARFHQDGTSPYTIVPVNAKALRFMTPGGVVYTKKVRHPGLPKRPFIMIQKQDIKDMKDLALDYMLED